jgi:UDP-N-acetyl-D-glucosamine dehydrogenase
MKGARVEYHDPHVPWISVNGIRLESVEWSAADLAGRDVVLVTTAHAGYDWPAIVRESRLVVDTRNATGGLDRTDHVIRL